ncbi:glycosyltransferase family 62 protein [Babjeviella inositovora NRRL Y-12698]|uniref:Glycosyltransferase family 62 protein n=1 Tax=Babjeviella inositovora NRRL Y-12698 TaxID=984486 RepID=A0A1E3QZX2_9ASCO|nr:glycosyltransferase family 62 protein [Babjeviella inositovora NRRL Y-12698]ODQ83223.1 glycosyltransferase family 62 protein [Babjeviella inositovora NRRL Y-12698]
MIADTYGKKSDLPVHHGKLAPKTPSRGAFRRLYQILGAIATIALLVFYFTRKQDLPEVKSHEVYTVTADGVRKGGLDGVQSEEDLDKLYHSTVEFYDLNDYQGTHDGNADGDVVLFCMPLRNAEAILPTMFKHIMNLTYAHEQIDLAFLVSDCSDDDDTLGALFDYTVSLQAGKLGEKLYAEETEAKKKSVKGSSDLYLNYMDPDYVERVQNAFQPPFHAEYSKPFRSVQIFHKDFGQLIGQGFSDRHDVKVQGIRRKLMGRARNWLVYNALKPYHSWVYWRDVDIEMCPGDVIQHLMKFNIDVIVPNVWRPLPEFLGNEQPYDLNSWIESEQGLELAKTLQEDDVIVEGYAEYPTWRAHLAYIRTKDGNPDELIALDGVGGVSILAKARVFRQGAMFPAFTFENHAETEAFGKLAKRMGFIVGGLPHYTIWHIYEPSEDDLQEIARKERKRRHQRKGKQN